MRSGDTYRSERRNAWAVARRFSSIPWREWNVAFHAKDGFSVMERDYPVRITRERRDMKQSKYMPHQGKREMARRVKQAA